jgi:hypothetical protein
LYRCWGLCVQVGVFKWVRFVNFWFPFVDVVSLPITSRCIHSGRMQCIILYSYCSSPFPSSSLKDIPSFSHSHHSCSRRQLIIPTSSMKRMGSSMWNIRLIKKDLSPQDYEIHLRSPTPCLPSKPVSEINEYTVG